MGSDPVARPIQTIVLATYDGAGYASVDRDSHDRRGCSAREFSDSKNVFDYMKGPDFAVAAFKGRKLTVRDWDLQLRQPILLTDGRVIVSVSPQEGFLHQFSELDTLGIDRPETKCRLK